MARRLDEDQWDFDRNYLRDHERERIPFNRPYEDRPHAAHAAVQDSVLGPVEIEHCTSCGKPAHPNETTDDGVCIECLGGES
jgi:hypothetical protein